MMSLHCEKNWGGNFENMFFLMLRQREGKHWHSCPLLVFAPLLSIPSCSLLWFSKRGVLEREGEARSSAKPLCWHQRKKRKRKRERLRKTKRQSGLLKSSRASAGATARVQAQLCNKERGGWIRDRRVGWRWGVLVKSPVWCVFVFCATQLLSSPYGNTHAHTHI